MAEQKQTGPDTKPLEFYAHTDPENPGLLPENGGRWQLLREHLSETARLAQTFADAFGAGDWGYLAGLLHDLGKYSKEFQDKLLASENAHIEQTARVDHSTYGAQKINIKWPNGEGKTLAYVIAGHHAGLPDGKNNEESCLTKRLGQNLPYHFHCPDSLDYTRPQLPFSLNKNRMAFEISFFIRMLYAALVDADFLDTEKRMNPGQNLLRPSTGALSKLLSDLESHLCTIQKEAEHTSVNHIRSEILNYCSTAADSPPGLFSLTVPTGGGKTLSSMAFALKHAGLQGFKRVIYVIPYTSIIEQNADVFRKIFGPGVVLEHHSNFEHAEEDVQTRLAAENWDAPIIVTTNVQFYESLFANRSSRCRKLHHIAESVIILDEVQSLPDHHLLPCIEVLRELSLHYRTSIVLCSATQPAIQKRVEFPAGLENVREIIPDPVRLSRQMKRVRIEVIEDNKDDILIQRLGKHEQVLCVVNTKKHARKLYHSVKEHGHTYHLSALMYPDHRRQILKKIKSLLKDGQPCRVISTQLIEAGVDIDFPVVYRAIAGLDSIAQAAGRCNREGRSEFGNVYVFEPEEGLPRLGNFRLPAQAAQSVIRRFPDDLLSLDAIEEYFKDYYWQKGDKQLDKKEILIRLKEGIRNMDFPFKQIAHDFQIIEQDTKPLIIPRDEKAQKLIEEIRGANSLRGYSRKLQKYTVAIHPHYWNQLDQNGHIEIVRDIFPILRTLRLYDEDTGLNIYDPNDPDPEDLIC